MPVSDQDLELLEMYLDREITDAQEKALLDRLIKEPQLASAFETIKAERQVRAALWQSCEPGDELVEKLMGRVQRKVDDHYSWTKRLSQLRLVGSMAACIMVGVMVGWVGRSRNTVTPPAQPGGALAVRDIVRSEPRVTPLVDEYGRFVGYSTPDSDRTLDEAPTLPATREPVPSNNVVPVADEF